MQDSVIFLPTSKKGGLFKREVFYKTGIISLCPIFLNASPPSNQSIWNPLLLKDDKEPALTSEEELPSPAKPTPTKNLRFFGDTDIESNDSIRHKPLMKTRSALSSTPRSQSTRDLHNISEERGRSPRFTPTKNGHKSMLNISTESDRETKGDT